MSAAAKKRECPIDWTPLVAESISVPGFDVQADRCAKCKGLFLDKGEIKRITGNDKLNELLTKHLAGDSDSPLVCPACGWTMDMEDADGVRVDVCLKCFGVWLDAGELDQLKEKKADAFDPMYFSQEKLKELRRSEAAQAGERKKFWSAFMHRLTGRDLIGGRKPR